MITQTLPAIRTLFHWEDIMYPLPRHVVVWMRVVPCVVGACLSAVVAAQTPGSGARAPAKGRRHGQNLGACLRHKPRHNYRYTSAEIN